MTVKFTSTVIFVSDIRKSADFYMNILEQEIEHDFDTNISFKSGLALWKITDSHEIARVMADKTEGNKFEIYFETKDIDKVASLLKKHNVKLLHEIKTEPWGQKTIRFFDPDAHLIEIGETFHTFLSRIYGETASLSKTAEITGVPEVTIRGIISLS